MAKVICTRVKQLPDGPVKGKYEECIIACAKRYLNAVPDIARTIYPKVLCDVIMNQLDAYEISGDEKFLELD